MSDIFRPRLHQQLNKWGAVKAVYVCTALLQRDGAEYLGDRVKVERAGDMGVALEHPMCITGQGACPPDDVGGVPGFENFVQAMADPALPEHDELTGWYGSPFDPAAFSAADVQERLDEIKL